MAPARQGANISISIEAMEAFPRRVQRTRSHRESVFSPKRKGNRLLDFLIDETEKWCKERAVYLALLESISIHDGKGDKTRDSIPSLLTRHWESLLMLMLVTIIFNDYKERYEFYHLKEERISFGLGVFRQVLRKVGSLIRLSTSLLLVQVLVSLYSCAFASNVLLQGKNVIHYPWRMRGENCGTN